MVMTALRVCSWLLLRPHASQSGATRLLVWKLHTASHQATVALNCVCEHLCFISIYFVHSISQMYPEVTVSSLYTISFYEKFHRNSLLSDSKRNLYIHRRLLLFSHKVMSDSFATSWTIAHQDPLSMEFPRQEHWSGLPFPSPGDLPDPGIKLKSPAL